MSACNQEYTNTKITPGTRPNRDSSIVRKWKPVAWIDWLINSTACTVWVSSCTWIVSSASLLVRAPVVFLSAPCYKYFLPDLWHRQRFWYRLHSRTQITHVIYRLTDILSLCHMTAKKADYLLTVHVYEGSSLPGPEVAWWSQDTRNLRPTVVFLCRLLKSSEGDSLVVMSGW